MPSYNKCVNDVQQQAVRVLTGPTGSGKSALALMLARRHEAEIVSMDSMALYRGMDIGTAKPDTRAREEVPHHLVDVLDPWESANVAWWLDRAQQACAEIAQRGRRALLVGGTPLYLKAFLFGIFAGAPTDPDIRRRLEEEVLKIGSQALHEQMRDVDPTAAARIHPNDRRRVVRALEVWRSTGRPISAWQAQWQGPSVPIEIWCLSRPRAELYDRIDARVDAMFAVGLVEEVRGLLALPKPLSREAGQALGYKETIAHLRGEMDLEETVREVKTRSRNFAKRQLTWFRQLPGCSMLSAEEIRGREW